jgi:hypothetical protein
MIHDYLNHLPDRYKEIMRSSRLGLNTACISSAYYYKEERVGITLRMSSCYFR